jgi:uncharacterized protein (DUF4213/DUF364 family)
MSLVDKLLQDLTDGAVDQVIIGLHWTAVSIYVENVRYCGLSSTVSIPHRHGSGFDVPDAGHLTEYSAVDLANFCKSNSATLASVGTAALNALLQQRPAMVYQQINAEELIVEFGSDKNVTIVGHFPFTERVRAVASTLYVLENNPAAQDLPASMAPEVIPQSQVVAITGMAFVNKTLENLLSLCQPDAKVIILGASTPLHPLLFDYGIDYLSGALTVNIDAVLQTVAEGAVYRQITKAGLKLVSAQKERNQVGL